MTGNALWPEIEFELPRKTARQRERALQLLAALDARYPHAKCRLDWKVPHELLIATILSAQATDEGVNAATPALFAQFPTANHFASSSADEIAPFIRTIGLWRNKARAVHESMRTLVDQHGGEVPKNMKDLLALRGVARKTANVVLGVTTLKSLDSPTLSTLKSARPCFTAAAVRSVSPSCTIVGS